MKPLLPSDAKPYVTRNLSLFPPPLCLPGQERVKDLHKRLQAEHLLRWVGGASGLKRVVPLA